MRQPTRRHWPDDEAFYVPCGHITENMARHVKHCYRVVCESKDPEHRRTFKPRIYLDWEKADTYAYGQCTLNHSPLVIYLMRPGRMDRPLRYHMRNAWGGNYHNPPHIPELRNRRRALA